MSNNKQSMKLYTEDQLIELAKAAFTAGKNYNPFIFSEELKNITPIELPSDKEIEEEALKREYFELSFFNGAKMVISKIQGGNNEQQ